MFFVEGRSYGEIASIVALPLSTVRGRIHQSRLHLRKEIEMTRQPLVSSPYEREQTLRPRGGRLSWCGMKVRFLGSSWTGNPAMYDASGRRLTRIPARLGKSSLFLGPREPESPAEGRHLLSFWELSGAVSWPSNYVTPLGLTASGAACPGADLPMPLRVEDVGGRQIVCCALRAPEGERHLHYRGTIVGPCIPDGALRLLPGADMLDLEGAGWISISGPFGCSFMGDRRRGRRKGTCTFTFVLSSSAAQRPHSLTVVDRDGHEHEPAAVGGGCVWTPSGPLMAATLDVDLPPEKVAGVVLRPHDHVRFDWGRIRIPQGA